MSYDLVALTAAEPDALLLARVLREAVPDGVVRPLAGGGVLEVLDRGGNALFAVEPAQRVDVPGEALRLLGADAAAGPPEGRCWWVELHARPHGAAREAAVRAADALVLRLGGNVWTPCSGVERLVEGAAAAGAPRTRPGAAGHPLVSFEAEDAVVVVQDREVVPLSAGISDVLAVHGAQRRGLQVLTPASARVTHALRALLSQPLARWVVADGDGGHFDGISGLPLVWHSENGFVPRRPPGSRVPSPAGVETGAPEPAPGFLDPDPLGVQLVVDLVVEHTRPLAPPLGRAAEVVAEHLAGTRPAGWGTHEPALGPWSRGGITRMARHRAPGGVVLHLAGPVGPGGAGAFAGGIRVSWDGERARERVSLVFGHPGEPPLEALPPMVEALAGEGLLSTLHVRRGRGRPDVTFAPRWHGVLAPVGMAVGPGAVAEAGEEALVSGPLPGEVLDGPAVWYPVPGAGEERYRSTALVAAQVRHLTAAGRD
ncbi:hypothetical protein SUDANB121_02305 [Nocardiopsis dassonvillei]|uniref:DUF6177 family protein n=1 Tax=Nocardiopsis dassonvillei TaxID=2014 RepID=UPI003F5786D4